MLNKQKFAVLVFPIWLVCTALLVGACRDRPDSKVALAAFEAPDAVRKVQIVTGQEPGSNVIDISSAHSLEAIRQWISACRPIELIGTYPAPYIVMHVTFLDGTRVDVAFSDPGTYYAILDLGGKHCMASEIPGIPELREWLAEVEERNKRNSGNFRQDP